MALRNRRLQTVDLIRHLVDPPTVGVPQLDERLRTSSFVASMTDLVCPVELRDKGRNMLMSESSGLWVVFVDEHARLDRGWFETLSVDLNAVAEDYEVACSVGSLDRSGLTSTLDVAYRRSALDHLGGFAHAEDWSLDREMQARLIASGHVVRSGTRSQIRRSD